jgi:hypothetical protein
VSLAHKDALRGEDLQRLARRHAADAEALRQRRLHDALAGLQVAGRDRLHHRVGGGLGEGEALRPAEGIVEG